MHAGVLTATRRKRWYSKQRRSDILCEFALLGTMMSINDSFPANSPWLFLKTLGKPNNRQEKN